MKPIFTPLEYEDHFLKVTDKASISVRIPRAIPWCRGIVMPLFLASVGPFWRGEQSDVIIAIKSLPDEVKQAWRDDIYTKTAIRWQSPLTMATTAKRNGRVVLDSWVFYPDGKNKLFTRGTSKKGEFAESYYASKKHNSPQNLLEKKAMKLTRPYAYIGDSASFGRKQRYWLTVTPKAGICYEVPILCPYVRGIAMPLHVFCDELRWIGTENEIAWAKRVVSDEAKCEWFSKICADTAKRWRSPIIASHQRQYKGKDCMESWMYLPNGKSHCFVRIFLSKQEVVALNQFGDI